jgi:hypothetical protein
MRNAGQECPPHTIGAGGCSAVLAVCLPPFRKVRERIGHPRSWLCWRIEILLSAERDSDSFKKASKSAARIPTFTKNVKVGQPRICCCGASRSLTAEAVRNDQRYPLALLVLGGW